MSVLEFQDVVADREVSFKGGGDGSAQGHAARSEVSAGMQVRNHVVLGFAGTKETVPGALLEMRVQHLVPSLRIQVVGGQVKGGVTSRRAIANAREAGRSAESDLGDSRGGVAQGQAIVVQFQSRAGDFYRNGEAGNFGSRVFQLRRADHFGSRELRPVSADGEIDGSRAGEGDLGRSDAGGAGTLLEALQRGVSLDMKSESLVVEHPVHAGGSGRAEGKVKALHNESPDRGLCRSFAAATFGLDRLRGISHCDRFSDNEILAENGGVNHEVADYHVADPGGRLLGYALGMERSGNGTLGGEILGKIALGAARKVEQGVGRQGFGHDREIVVGRAQTLQAALNREESPFEWDAAIGVLELIGAHIELAGTGCVEICGVAGGDVVAAEITQLCGGSELESGGGAAELDTGLKRSAPAAILAIDQAGKVSKLDALPSHGAFHG